MRAAVQAVQGMMVQITQAILLLWLAMVAMALTACDNAPAPSDSSKAAPDPAAFSILATSDLRDAEALAGMIQQATGVKVRFIFGGTMESADKVINGKAETDAAWFANAKYVLSDPAGQARVKMQEKIMLLMPIVFTFLFWNFSSGLVLYWLVNNVISIGQQYYINKKAT